MKLFRIKDNSGQKKESFSHIKNLTGKIADKAPEQLESEGVFVFPEIIKDAEDITQNLESDANQNNRLFNFLLFLFLHYR